MRCNRLFLLITAASVFNPGCDCLPKDVKQESEEWKQKATDLQNQMEKAQADFKQQSEQWQATTLKLTTTIKDQSEAWQKQTTDLSVNMVKAADSVDPLAMKEVYRDSKELAKINEGLKKLIAEGSGGDLLLTGSRLRMDVKRFKGKMIAKAWVDAPEALVFSRQLEATNPKLKLDTDVVGESFLNDVYSDAPVTQARFAQIFAVVSTISIADAATRQQKLKEAQDKVDNAIKKSFLQQRERANKEYENRVAQAFASFLQTGAYETPMQDTFQFFLEHQLRKSGRHEIDVSVTPTSKDWELLIEIFEISEDGKAERRLKSWQLNPSLVDDPQKIAPLVLWVRYAEAPQPK